jgi:hypothetical protein
MSRLLEKRLQRLESHLMIASGNSVSLEELCRSLWDENPDGFRRFAATAPLSYFIRQFECEDTEPDVPADNAD